MQATPHPSVRACEALLEQMPALAAFRRTLQQLAPEQARSLIAPLAIVCRHPDGVRLGQVADALHVDISVASRHITQLEERGLISRTPDPADRRALLLHATTDGERWLCEVRMHLAERVRTLLPGWDDDDVHTLAHMLDRFGKSIEHSSRSARVTPCDAQLHEFTALQGAPA